MHRLFPHPHISATSGINHKHVVLIRMNGVKMRILKRSLMTHSEDSFVKSSR
jgi:hypothetical protein